MTRNLKALGLALLAVLAVGAVAAQLAQAQVPEFHCTSQTAKCWVKTSGGTHGTGSNDHVITFGTSEAAKTPLKCTGSTEVDGVAKTGTILRTTATIGFEATYTGCKLFGVKATVAMNGCTYLVHLVAGSSPATATTDVVCPAGKTITITSTGIGCTITIGAQTGLSHIVFTNVGTEPTHVAGNITVAGTTYTTTGAECPEAGTHNNGTYTGTTTLTAFEHQEPATGPKVGFHVF